MSLSYCYYLEQKIKKLSLDQGCLLNCFLLPLSSQNSIKENRNKLRKHLIYALKKQGCALSRTDEKKLLNLKIIPTVSDYFISISHCPSLGGFLLGKNQIHIGGLDLEIFGRAKNKTLNRITQQKEILKFFPSPSHLWSAKEASYKSLIPFNPHLHIKDFSISDWKKKRLSLYEYKFKTKKTSNNRGSGFCFVWKKNITVAVSLCKNVL